jgi:hypothetical protein
MHSTKSLLLFYILVLYSIWKEILRQKCSLILLLGWSDA